MWIHFNLILKISPQLPHQKKDNILHTTASSIFPVSLFVAREAAQQNSVGEEKKEEEEEEDLSLAYAARGQGNTPDPVEFFLHFLKYFNTSFCIKEH